MTKKKKKTHNKWEIAAKAAMHRLQQIHEMQGGDDCLLCQAFPDDKCENCPISGDAKPYSCNEYCEDVKYVAERLVEAIEYFRKQLKAQKQCLSG